MVQIQRKIGFSILISVIGLSLVGCSTYSKDFDCPYGKGLGCASVSKVDKMVDSHLINTDETLSGHLSPTSTKKQIHIYHGPNTPGQILTIDTLSVK